MGRHVVRAEVWEHSPGEPGSWHFLTVPREIADDVALEGGPREGFGSIRVQATIGSTFWWTSLFPDTETGSYVLPLKKQVRRAEGLSAGTMCEVVLEVDAGGMLGG